MPVKIRIRLGTRGSSLALAQTKLVADLLMAAHEELEVVTVPLKTLGDLLPPEKLTKVDGKTAFTGEIEKQLLAGKIDVAVHSMKDLPIALGEGLVVAATPKRGDPRDALVSKEKLPLKMLKAGARIGTSSVRRRAQLLAIRGDLEVVEIHGNVETRIQKIAREGLDGVVLAAAGLWRTGLDSNISEIFEIEEMVPAACQGILAVEARKDDETTVDLVSPINDRAARVASVCERAFAEELGGDCYVPLGAFARLKGASLVALGMVASLDGKSMVKLEEHGPASDAEAIGKRLGAKVADAGGRPILEGLRP
jgi:hydroxymethylbilane synthase